VVDPKSDVKGEKKMNKNQLEMMKESLKIQGYDGNWNYDEYMHGMYNGMELMLAIAENREPKYREKPKQWLEVNREDVKQSCLITNGEPHKDTIKGYEEAGHILLKTEKANKYHPYAMDTDCISFFAKPIDKEKYDSYMDEFRKTIEMPQGC
jgi:hypothetical protein